MSTPKHFCCVALTMLLVLPSVVIGDCRGVGTVDECSNDRDRFLLTSLWNKLQDTWIAKRFGLTEVSIEHDGLTRWYLEHKPSALEGAPALVIVLHGGSGSMYGIFRNNSPASQRWVTLSDDEGFLLLAPNGINGRTGETKARSGNFWNIFRQSPALTSTADDVGFLTALVQRAIQEHGVDSRRVYVTGASNGGAMTQRLLIEDNNNVFAAGVSFIANLAAANVPANPASPKPIMIMNGDEDPVMPWAGGTVGNNRGEVRSAFLTRDFWVNGNSANAGGVVITNLPDTDPSDGCRIVLEQYPATNGGAPVFFYTMQGGGHVYPSTSDSSGAAEAFVGPPCRDAEAADLSWAFMTMQG